MFSRKYCKAIIDDLLLFTPSKTSHIAKLEDLLKALLKNGLRISPKKCQLFRKELHYMGNTIFIEVKPLRSRCRRFTGMVNFLSLFCSKLQKLLKPIYGLKIKGRQFIWTKEQQLAFEEIKCILVKLPVLHLPNSKGRFHLYSDMSKFATGECFISNSEWKTKTDSICKQKTT